jgi:peptidoglycan hydrolase CwlO-like protein
MNGRAINKLIKLKKVDLSDNICVSGSFESFRELNKLYATLEINCRYDEEPMKKLRQLEDEVKGMRMSKELTKNYDTKLSQAFELIEKLKAKDEEIEKMKQELKSLKEKIEVMERMEQDF